MRYKIALHQGAGACEIRDGCKVTMLDRHSEMVALSHHVCLVIDSERRNRGRRHSAWTGNSEFRSVDLQYLAVIHASCSLTMSAFLAIIDVIVQSQSLHS